MGVREGKRARLGLQFDLVEAFNALKQKGFSMFSAIRIVFDQIIKHPLCRVLPPTRLPVIPAAMRLPAEVEGLYTHCGGIAFLDSESGHTDYRILPPEKFFDIGTATCLEPARTAPLMNWYTFGEDDNGGHVVVDLSPHFSGRCYDVFHETRDGGKLSRQASWNENHRFSGGPEARAFRRD